MTPNHQPPLPQRDWVTLAITAALFAAMCLLSFWYDSRPITLPPAPNTTHEKE